MNTPETAPRDGTQILGDFGWPWLQVAAWSEGVQKWAVAEFGLCPFTQDARFETEYEDHSMLKAWVPLPPSR